MSNFISNPSTYKQYASAFRAVQKLAQCWTLANDINIYELGYGEQNVVSTIHS